MSSIYLFINLFMPPTLNHIFNFDHSRYSCSGFFACITKPLTTQDALTMKFLSFFPSSLWYTLGRAFCIEVVGIVRIFHTFHPSSIEKYSQPTTYHPYKFLPAINAVEDHPLNAKRLRVADIIKQGNMQN